MKKFILFVALSLSVSVFAATHYVTPSLVVEKSQLYCTNNYGDVLSVYPIGDIINGGYAVGYCSYNKSTVENKMKYISEHTDRKRDENFKSALTYLMVVLIIGLFISILGAFGFYRWIRKIKISFNKDNNEKK